MKTKHKTTLLLIIITIISLILRLHSLNSYPPLLWDEASLGYNAYSILTTGKDEHGAVLPIFFKSFGDYKPGLYVYLTIPFVYIFGLNTLSVRLPSALLGSLLPLVFYLLVKRLTGNRKLSLICALVLAFNPYNLHYSKGAWETNLLLFELCLASLLYYHNKYNLAAVILGLTIYSYQSGKIFSLILILVIFLSKLSSIKNNKPAVKALLQVFPASFMLIFLTFSIPAILGLIFSPQGDRLKVLSLFSYHRSIQETAEIKKESFGPLDYNLFHSEAIYFLRNFILRYFNNFSPKFLIFEGDWQNPRHSAPYAGVILIPSFAFLIIGLFVRKTVKSTKAFIFFILLLLLSPIPASLTRDTIQATRSLPFSLPLVYFTSLGLYQALKLCQKLLMLPRYFSFALVCIIYLFAFIYYQDLYYSHMIKKSPKDWLYGYQQAIEYIKHNRIPETKVYLTNFYGQPYIFYLFFNKFPPTLYQQQSKLISTGPDVGQIYSIKSDNIIFTSPDFNNLKYQPNTLIVISDDEVLRQGIDKNLLTPLSQIGGISTFYGYKTY